MLSAFNFVRTCSWQGILSESTVQQMIAHYENMLKIHQPIQHQMVKKFKIRNIKPHLHLCPLAQKVKPIYGQKSDLKKSVIISLILTISSY